MTSPSSSARTAISSGPDLAVPFLMEAGRRLTTQAITRENAMTAATKGSMAAQRNPCRSSSALTTLKTAVFAPIPSPSVAMTIAVKPGPRAIIRSA